MKDPKTIVDTLKLAKAALVKEQERIIKKMETLVKHAREQSEQR